MISRRPQTRSANNLKRWWGAIAAIGVLAGAAMAQPGGPKPATGQAGANAAPSYLPEKPLQDALNEAAARSRFLVVVTSPTREKEKANLAAWNNPALQQWIAWHGVLVHVKDQETIKTLRDAGLIVGLPDQPLVFRAGKQERLFGSIVRDDNHQPGGVRLRPPPAPAKNAKTPEGAASDRPDTSVRLLLRLDWTLRSLVARDRAWWDAHCAANPAPEAPSVPYAFRGVKDRADAALGEEGTLVDPAGRMLGLLKDWPEGGAVDGAAQDSKVEMCTWLWERSCEYAPAFEGAKLSTLARRWHVFGAASVPARNRVLKMIDAEAALLPWADDRRWFNWLMLKRIADEHVDALDFIDAALDDADAKLMLSTGDRGAWELMLPWLNWADPATLPGAEGDVLRLLRELKNRKQAKRPAKAEAEEWDRLQGLTDWLIRAEGSRVYAALLRSGRAADATRAAGMVLEAAPADGALWLTSAAVCEGVAREEQIGWLGGVKEPWAERLAAHVRRGIAEAQGK